MAGRLGIAIGVCLIISILPVTAYFVGRRRRQRKEIESQKASLSEAAEAHGLPQLDPSGSGVWRQPIPIYRRA